MTFSLIAEGSCHVTLFNEYTVRLTLLTFNVFVIKTSQYLLFSNDNVEIFNS